MPIVSNSAVPIRMSRAWLRVVTVVGIICVGSRKVISDLEPAASLAAFRKSL